MNELMLYKLKFFYYTIISFHIFSWMKFKVDINIQNINSTYKKRFIKTKNVLLPPNCKKGFRKPNKKINKLGKKKIIKKKVGYIILTHRSELNPEVLFLF